MNFRKINNITGGIVGILASLVYVLTREANGSFWDTGEFISSAYKLENPHPPGAPLFSLLGRFFIILMGDNPETAARAVNLMSALASGATILFLFWTITHFSRKLFVKVNEEPTGTQTATIMLSGIAGAMAYTFTDSFWFSAVEGEVYALSSMFTALVFWAMLKWEHAFDSAGADNVARVRADRWIVFISFMMGLSIGVHLLNLLTIPALVMIYYFRRYNYTLKGTILAFIVGCIITGLVQVLVIQWSVALAGKFDILFVNSFGLPFFSGFVFFFVLLAFLIWFGLRVARRKGWTFLRLGLWCFVFMMVGYSAYLTSLIRSNANTAIDMNNVDNPMSLVYWLSREQYGEAPLIYGPHFQAQVAYDKDGRAETVEGAMKYTKGKDRYIPLGRERDYKYNASDMQLFPRIWDRSDDQNHATFYVDWLNLKKVPAKELSVVSDVQYDQNTARPISVQTQNQSGQTETYYIDDDYSLKVNRRGELLQPGDPIAVKNPGLADNLQWFITYQNGLMYWRYFMWNFAGRQNDLQGYGNKRDGNWISGYPIVDYPRLGDQTKMPDSLNNNKAHNRLFLLPFFLGVFGCVFQFLRNKRDWVVNFLLFFFTGIAIVLYLNQPGNQPRERDYAYVGSFYAFAIWIGLAITGYVQMARNRDKKLLTNTLIYGSVLSFIITAFSAIWGPGAALSALVATALFAVFSAIVIFAGRASSGSSLLPNIIAGLFAIGVPILMAQQEWDDHDRSHKTLAPDLAKDYLESCDPNAVLFTFGDNDTYPLWYAQEVQGVRPDIRIINTSLLGIDWYINQLRYKINDADSLNVIWSPEQIEGHSREYMTYQPAPNVDQTQYYDLFTVMKGLGNPSIDPETGRDVGMRSYPVNRFKVPVDVNLVRKNGTVNSSDSVVSEMTFEIPQGQALMRNDLIMLNIIATNNWKRPIYFTSPYGQLGFGQYIRKDGLSYRLVPTQVSDPRNQWVVESALREARVGGTGIRATNNDTMYQRMMTKFAFGNASHPGVYFDEENRRHLLNIRQTYAELAGNLADAGKKDEAAKTMEKVEDGISPSNMPYAMASRYGNSHNQTALVYLEAAYKAGKKELADTIRKDIEKDLKQQQAYFNYLRTERPQLYNSFPWYESAIVDSLLEVLNKVVSHYDSAAAQQPPAPVESNGGTISNQAADSVVQPGQ